MGYDTAKPQVGFLAQEIQNLIPEAVNDDGEKMSIIYDKIIPYLVEAIKELKAEVDELKKGK